MTTKTVTINVQVHDLRDGSKFDRNIANPGDYAINTSDTGEIMYALVDQQLLLQMLVRRWGQIPEWLSELAGDDQ